MPYQKYDLPASVTDLFINGEQIYSIVDYRKDMDNIEALQYFLECCHIPTEYIDVDDGTQVILKKPDFAYKIVIDCSGMGDFYSHQFEVSFYII